MNEKTEKKIRREVTKAAGINIHKTYVGMIHALMDMPFKKRLKFSYCLVFRKHYK